MNKTIIIALAIIAFSCSEKREIRYSGFNDLVVGSQTVNLYHNGEFNIELGMGYQNGKYHIKNDTVRLKYDSPSDLPRILLIKEDSIIIFGTVRPYSIKRTDNIR